MMYNILGNKEIPGDILVGYVDEPQATAETLVSGGWLRTGDVCYIDDEGYLYVVDRLKEMIKYKGYQVIDLSHIFSI